MELRHGFTTGSCSAAAAKAATYMLLTKKNIETIRILTPKKIPYEAQLLDLTRGEDFVSCGVRKDGGDDVDVTTGAVVYAKVRLLSDFQGKVWIDGGEGVGRVTKPGLNQPVGSAAINSTPRAMIEENVREILDLFEEERSVEVIISVPGGEEIAKKTYNPRFGVMGGISILGTTGIVMPMSNDALLETIEVELKQLHTLGVCDLVIAPGNYGMDFMKETYGYSLDHAVKCSNFIGDTLEMAASIGFSRVLLCGHIGKLIKLSGGMWNTHSKCGDCRMELMVAAGLSAGMSPEHLKQMLNCVSTVAAYDLVKEAGVEKEFMEYVMKKIASFLERKVGGRYEIECMVYSNEEGLLGCTKGAIALLEEIRAKEAKEELP
ncbi:MAG: cobalt-precorrin-5B (C(1))-methyltransferase CbiD [Lachnospiraceae bacterium]|nr:cobalt-precorrin-5B (C(1))-methyltransferase CbiD [Lachnospiraceae bacterium]